METRIMLSRLMMFVILLTTGCTSVGMRPEILTGQHPQSFENEIGNIVRIKYLLYLPDQYQESKTRWPLLMFLHGAGERGDDLEKVKIHGPPKLIAKEEKEFPFVIVSPQCPKDGWWSNELQIETLNALLDDIVSRYRIDKDRIYLTGLSMGSFGTWYLATEYPDKFAAIAPICGKGDPAKAARLRHLPVWIFHGADDKAVPLKSSLEMAEALEKVGGNVKLTVYPNVGHDSWTQTYNNPEFYQWLLKHKRTSKK